MENCPDAAREYFAENEFVLSLSKSDLRSNGFRNNKSLYYERYYRLVSEVPDVNGKLSLREYSTLDAASMRSLAKEGIVVKLQIGEEPPESINGPPNGMLLRSNDKSPAHSTVSIEVICEYETPSDQAEPGDSDSGIQAKYLTGVIVGTVRDKTIVATVFPPDLSRDTESIKSIFVSQKPVRGKARIIVQRQPENIALLECDFPGSPFGLVGPPLALHQRIALSNGTRGSAIKSQDPGYLTTKTAHDRLCGEPVFQNESKQLIAIMGMRPRSGGKSIGELKSDGTLIPVATIRDLLQSHMQSLVSGKSVFSQLRGRIGFIPNDTFGEWQIGGQPFVVSRKTSLERESRMIFPDKKAEPDEFKVGMVVDVEYRTENGVQYASEIEIQKRKSKPD